MRIFIYPFLALAFFCQNINSQELVNKRAEWFVNDRFGMFIHWGVYSAAEGMWKGENLRHDNNYAEWIQYRNNISKDEYLTLLNKFDWDNIEVEKWVLLAKESGMKYITITAKHHDGFCLWDSKIGNYDLGNFANRDIIKELADACKKHNIKLGFYYSHWIDWEHEFGWNHSKELTGINQNEYNIYWQEKVIPQVRELLTNYGEISMMWFDMWIDHSQTCVTKEQLMQLKKMIRELQPNCLINSRLGLSLEEDNDIDFQTIGDNQLGNEKKNFPWQSPGTVAHSWGYNAFETDFKSTTFLLQALVNNVSLNGNYLLNIGPKANGDIPFEISQRLLEIGEWLKTNGESVYGAKAFDLRKDLHDWGRITFNEQTNKLYLHVFNWPLKNELNITGIISKPLKMYMLSDKDKKPLAFEHNNSLTTVKLPNKQTDPFISVIVMEFDIKPEIIKGLVAKNSEGGYSLTPQNINIKKNPIKIEKKQKYGTIPEMVKIDTCLKFTWKIYIEKPAKKNVSISYSSQLNQSNSYLTVDAAGQKIQSTVQYSGKTIGEPNSNWEIEKFKSFNIGEINFAREGYYEIELEFNIVNNDKMNFQWLWIE